MQLRCRGARHGLYLYCTVRDRPIAGLNSGILKDSLLGGENTLVRRIHLLIRLQISSFLTTRWQYNQHFRAEIRASLLPITGFKGKGTKM